MNSYSFRRSFRSFFDGASIDGNDAGYWLNLYSNGKEIVCGGTGEIIVDGHVYRIGYWGNKAELEMMNKIRDVLELE